MYIGAYNDDLKCPENGTARFYNAVMYSKYMHEVGKANSVETYQSDPLGEICPRGY